MSKPININDSVGVIPSGTTGSTNITTNNNYPLSNGYNGVSNTSNYARLQLNASSTNTDCYIYYTFNVQGVPSNATITSVSCVARAYLNSRTNNATLQLYSNTTAKGSGTSFTNTSASNITVTDTGSWTVSDLSNLRLRIKGRRSSTNNSSYIYFYGSDVTINYSISGTAYEITARSDYSGATILPASQDVMSGDSCTLQISADSLTNIKVEDNGTDVTEDLQYVVPSGGQQTFNGIPTSFDSANSTYDSIYEGDPSNGLSGNTDTNRICVYVTQTAYAENKLTYNFDCSTIPQNATITGVSCVAAAACYSNGQYFDTRTVQLYSGSTAKGTATTITGTGNTRTDHNIDGGSWTRAELDNAKIVIRVVRGNNTTQASFSFWGATLTVTYTLPQTPYYEYTLTNVSADHTIVVMENVIIPPEEDPQKTYYNLTISSINATTDPPRGTTRIESGTNQTITIYPSDPQVTLITDNGVDVSSQLVAHGGTIPTPTVATASGASYGFTLNSGTGYYVSQNTGVDKSAAVCVVSFDLPVRCLVTIQYINYAEATYDFGVFGNIDTPLSNNYYAAGSGGATITDSSYKLACNTSAYNTSSVQTITYEIPSGQHDVYIKYSKDDATGSNNDTLQWKIINIEELENNNYYTYTLSNISQSHSLIFIFGNVSYYFVNSNGNENQCRLYPSGSMVQLPGDSYRLVIVPNDSQATVTATDNNVDITNQLQMTQVTTEKDGVQTTVVNYTYTLSNIQTTHTINVSASSAGLPSFIKKSNQWSSGTLYKKVSNAWTSVQYTRIYVKQNGSWVENQQATISTYGYVFGGEVEDQ